MGLCATYKRFMKNLKVRVRSWYFLQTNRFSSLLSSGQFWSQLSRTTKEQFIEAVYSGRPSPRNQHLPTPSHPRTIVFHTSLLVDFARDRLHRDAPDRFHLTKLMHFGGRGENRLAFGEFVFCLEQVMVSVLQMAKQWVLVSLAEYYRQLLP